MRGQREGRANQALVVASDTRRAGVGSTAGDLAVPCQRPTKDGVVDEVDVALRRGHLVAKDDEPRADAVLRIAGIDALVYPAVAAAATSAQAEEDMGDVVPLQR